MNFIDQSLSHLWDELYGDKTEPYPKLYVQAKSFQACSTELKEKFKKLIDEVVGEDIEKEPNPEHGRGLLIAKATINMVKQEQRQRAEKLLQEMEGTQ